LPDISFSPRPVRCDRPPSIHVPLVRTGRGGARNPPVPGHLQTVIYRASDVGLMVVIDMHVHVAKPGDWTPSVVAMAEKLCPDYEARLRSFIEEPAAMAKYFKAQGVDRVVLLAEDAPKVTGVVPNEFIRDMARSDEMFITFACIDPLSRKGAPALLEKCVTEYGMKGLKLLPTYNHHAPNDKRVYPILEKARDLGIPVMFHTGTSVFKGTRNKWGDPMFYDDLAVDFPELVIIMAHSGRPFWYDKAFYLSRMHENLYMEITGIPPKSLLEAFPRLESNADKILFGSDWPVTPGITKVIDGIRALDLPEKVKRAILGDNAARVLKIR